MSEEAILKPSFSGVKADLRERSKLCRPGAEVCPTFPFAAQVLEAAFLFGTPKWRSASSPSCWRARCPWRRRRLNRMRPGSSLRSAATTAASETTAVSPFRRRRRACAVERILTACADRRAAARWAPRASRAETSGSARKHRTSRAQASVASVATTSCASACTTRRTTITIPPRPSRRCCSC